MSKILRRHVLRFLEAAVQWIPPLVSRGLKNNLWLGTFRHSHYESSVFSLSYVTRHTRGLLQLPYGRTTCHPLSLLCRHPESCEGVESKKMDASISNIQSYLKTTPLSYAKIPTSRNRAQLTLESLKNSRLNSQVVCRLQLAASNRSVHICMSFRGGAR